MKGRISSWIRRKSNGKEIDIGIDAKQESCCGMRHPKEQLFEAIAIGGPPRNP